MTDAGGPTEDWSAPHEVVKDAGPTSAWAGPADPMPIAQSSIAPAAPLSAPVPAPAPYAAPGAVPGTAAQQASSAPLTFRSWRPGVLDLRPLSFGDFLSVPFRAFRFNRGVTIGGPAMMSVISVLLTSLAGYFFLTDPWFTSNMSLYGGVSNIQPRPIVFISIGIAALSWMATDLLAASIVLPGVMHAILGEKISLGRAWSVVGPRIGQLVLFYLLILLGSLVFVALFGLIAFGVGQAGDGSAAAIVVVLGFIVAIPAFALVGVYLPAVRGAIIMEKASAVKAIRRAIFLMKGRFWWTVLILFVVGAIVGFVSQIATTAGQLGGLIVGLVATGSETAFVIGMVVGVGIGTLLSYIITYALTGSVHALIYVDARMRREGFEIQLAQAAEARHTAAPGL